MLAPRCVPGDSQRLWITSNAASFGGLTACRNVGALTAVVLWSSHADICESILCDCVSPPQLSWPWRSCWPCMHPTAHRLALHSAEAYLYPQFNGHIQMAQRIEYFPCLQNKLLGRGRLVDFAQLQVLKVHDSVNVCMCAQRRP